MKPLAILTAAVLSAFFPSISHCWDVSSSLDTIGLRAGWDAERDADLTEISFYATTAAWKSWSLGESTSLNLGLEGQLGNLHGEGENSVFVSIAPTLVLACAEFPIRFSASSGPAYYSEDTFESFDLGNNFQFISSLGLEYSFTDHWAVGYRFQHTSNAGLSDQNPGLDMHLLSLSYIF